MVVNVACLKTCLNKGHLLSRNAGVINTFCQKSFLHVNGYWSTKGRYNLKPQFGATFTVVRKVSTVKMEAKSVKLIYLNIRGYAEVARLLFAYADQKYEDVRYEEKGDWLDVKTKMPLHHVPVLELDGVQFPQSMAIWNYLAKIFGLYPSTPKDQMIVDTVTLMEHDLCAILVSFYELEDGPEKTKTIEASWPKSVVYLNHLEKLLSQAGTGYFVENRLTLADIVLFDLVTGMNRHTLGPSIQGDVCEVADLKGRYPWISKCFDNVLKNERILEYVKSRKPSEF